MCQYYEGAVVLLEASSQYAALAAVSKHTMTFQLNDRTS